MSNKTNYKINGKDYFRLSASFGRDASGKTVRKFFYGKNKKEAERKLEEYKDSLNQGIVLDKNAYLSSTIHNGLFEVV